MVAEVIIISQVRALNRIFDYQVPTELVGTIRVGSKVLVPFGSYKTLTDAFVIGLKEKSDYKVKDIAKIEFSNGLQLECTPNTLVFTIDGWKSILALKPEDNILGAIFSPDTGIKGKIFHVVSGDLMKKLIPVNVYFFATENQNILIPHPESDAITFICIHQ